MFIESYPQDGQSEVHSDCDVDGPQDEASDDGEAALKTGGEKRSGCVSQVK